MLINAAHHARELTTISMTMYTMLRILHGYVHENNNGFIRTLLAEKALFFVPAVNYDGVALISEIFEKDGEIMLVRKNRHVYESMKQCELES